MPKIKTIKSVAKRFKVSKTGKLMKKKAGQNHFNSRESGNITRAKRKAQSMDHTMANPLKRLIPYSNKY